MLKLAVIVLSVLWALGLVTGQTGENLRRGRARLPRPDQTPKSGTFSLLS